MMIDKENVFIILTPGFAASETDTTCLPMQQTFVKALSGLHPDIKIIILSIHYPFVKQTYKWLDATVTSFNGRNKGGLSIILIRSKINRELKTIHKEKKIIGLLSFWLGECAYIGKKFGRANGIQHYCWLLGQDAKAKNKYVRKLSVEPNDLIALSDFLSDEFEKNYAIRPFAVIPPGIEGTSHVISRDIDLLGAGSLIPLKQFHIFIETVAAVKKQLPQVKAVLVGEGPEKNKLQKLIVSLDLQDNITLAGKIDHAAIIKIMQRTKILLHPSSYEGFSGVCQEALSSGAHVISFCRAMNVDIMQWHIVKSNNEMIERALSVLTNKLTTYHKLKFQSMKTTAKQIMAHYLKKL